MGQRSLRVIGAGVAALAAVAAGMAGLVWPAAAQQKQPQPQPPIFRSTVRLVRMAVTVKDNWGKPAGNLRKEDFTIYDNGAKQEVQVFEKESSQPLSVALMVDISGSTAKDLKGEEIAVRKFLHDFFGEGHPEDRMKLFSFNWEVTPWSGYTRSAEVIERGMAKFKAEAGTALYDAIFLGAQTLEDQPGRHVMLVVTDGGDTVSRFTYHTALEELHTSDTVFYGILVMPILNDAGRNIGGENALTQIALSTGGKVFFPTGGNAIGDPLAEILKDLRTQYVLGFYPKNTPLTKNRFHQVKVEVAKPGLRAVTRSGYYGEYDEGGAR